MKQIARWLPFLLMIAFVSVALAGNSNKSPLITAIVPSQPVVQSGGLTISVYGQNFDDKAQFGLCNACVNPDGTNSTMRPTKRLSTTQLQVQLQAGDLSRVNSYPTFVVQAGGVMTHGFFWAVIDGTVIIAPGDVQVALGQSFQFSATSTIAGDSIAWSLSAHQNGGQGTLSATGLFTAPHTLNAGETYEQYTVFATSSLNSSEQTAVVITVQ